MIKLISTFAGALLFGTIGSHLFATMSSAFGFVLGIMLFTVCYCVITVDDKRS